MGVLGDNVQRLFQFNERLMLRSGALPASGIYDKADFAWIASLEAGWRDIRDEYDELRGRKLPMMWEAFPVGPGDYKYVPPNSNPMRGSWTTYVLRTPEGELPDAAVRCPRTTKLLRQIPGLNIATFSIMAGGAVITPHRAPNRGSLRFLLALEIPEPAGSCGLRVGDEVIVWKEGDSILFDHGVVHEAWNETEHDRTMLFLETMAPLPFPLSTLNTIAQKGYRFCPGMQGSRHYLDELDQVLN